MNKRARSPTSTILRFASPTPRPNILEYLVGECDSTSKAPMVTASNVFSSKVEREASWNGSSVGEEGAEKSLRLSCSGCLIPDKAQRNNRLNECI